MDRGLYKYVCKDCGHEFVGVDMELNCTAESAPVKCPKCGSLNTSVTGSLLFDMCKEDAKNSSETCGNARRADKQLKYEII